MATNNKEQIFTTAEEMEYKVKFFNNLKHACASKCVSARYVESELNKGESVCIDRCVPKYLQVKNLVGQVHGSGRPPM